MLASLDIETSCGVEHCPGFGNSNSSECDHAVHHMLNNIDIIGVYDGKDYFNFKDVSTFDLHRVRAGWKFIMHGGKFDYKTLKAKGSSLGPKDIVGDTQLAGACVTDRVTEAWLKIYNEKRKELNEKLPPKQRHRVGTPLTLKTMAPFYLGTPPFWENPISHDDPEYNKLDCIYTYKLHEKLMALVESEGTIGFYENYLIPWQKLLSEAELEGVLIDETLLHTMYVQALKDLEVIENEVHDTIRPCFEAYTATKVKELTAESEAKCSAMCEKLKDKTKIEGTIQRYGESLQAKIEKLPTTFNLASPKQMLDILTWAGIDTTIDKKVLDEWIEAEGTNKFVLKRAKVKGNKFAEVILKYREKETEVQYLKQYINNCVGGRIYCSFSLVGTRTNRLNSSRPNLQNVKGSLRAPFIIADKEKYSIYTVDSSQIEPRFIAYLTCDVDMIKLFQQGRDFHNYATKKFFPHETQGVKEADIKEHHNVLRKTAKIGDLSIIYGTGKQTFQTMCLVREEMDININECEKMVKSFREGMGTVMKWKKGLETQYNNGTKIYNKFGCPVIAREGKVHMTLFNGYVQGNASQMVFHASLMAQREFWSLGYDCKPLLWVHDEVIWRFQKGKEEECKNIVDKYMKYYKLDTPHGNVPLDCEGVLSDHWQK